MKKEDKKELLVELLVWLQKKRVDFCVYGESDYWGTSGYQKINFDKKVWVDLFLEEKEHAEDV